MSAGVYNFTIEQGATFALEIEYTDSNGDPVDLNGYFAEMQLASDYADNSNRTLYTSLTGNYYDTYGYRNISLTGAYNDYTLADGKIGILLNPWSTRYLTFSECKYDLELYTTSDGSRLGTKIYSIRLLQGQIKISKEVTRYTNP